MSRYTAEQIAAANAAGKAPDLATCRAAAAEGRLYWVCTQNSGDDCLVDVQPGEGADEALIEVAASCNSGLADEPDLVTADGEDYLAYAERRRWSAERVALEDLP